MMEHHSIIFRCKESTVRFVTIAQSVSSKYQSLSSNMVKEFHYNFIMLPDTKHKF